MTLPPVDTSEAYCMAVCALSDQDFSDTARDLIHALRLALTAEASRLDWAMRHIPGRVFSDLGVTYSAGPDRDAIDAAMTLESANGR